MTLTPEESSKSSLELFAGARVDHRVDTAVEVAQPKDHLEYSVRWLQCWEEGTWKEVKVKSMVIMNTAYCCQMSQIGKNSRTF